MKPLLNYISNNNADLELNSVYVSFHDFPSFVYFFMNNYEYAYEIIFM